MHSWIVLILFGSLIVQILSRPQHTEYNNDSDAEETGEEEEGEPAAEEFLTDEEDTRLAEQEPAVQEDELPRSRHLLDLTESRYLQRNTASDDRLIRTKTDNFSDSKAGRNRDTREENPGQAHLNEQLQSFPRRRQSNRYIESSDEQEATQHLINRDVNKPNRIVQQNQPDNQINKRTVDFDGASNEEGEMLFEKNKDHVSKLEKNAYNNNEASDPNEQARYLKQYYNAMQAENRDAIDDKSRDGARYNYRDRREVKESNQAETSNASKTQGNKENTDNEDEESAIKRHIKKLTGEELDQLLSSLTDEKRELLKKIIDDVDATDNGYINKREITKKAGAVEENNFIENCQSDLSKVQGGSPVADLNTEPSPASNSDTTETSKQSDNPTEGSEISSSKSASESNVSSVNKIELTNRNDEAALKKAEASLNSFSLNLDPKNQGEVVANVQVSTKTENKRETNLDDLDSMSFEDSKTIDNDLNLLNGQDYANDQGYFSGQDDNLSKMLEDESQFNEDAKAYKREIRTEQQPDLSDSIKSLEESFPNSNAYDDSVAYSGPLVRVKRKNTEQVIKKRAAALLPDAKVGYFPYKAENEDEDNDEGNEFDDEGFYGTSNFANGNKGLEDESANGDNSGKDKISNVDNSKLPHKNLEGDTMSLGSDTDSVLSGVEGVDDNLMFNNGARARRTAEDKSSGIADVKPERSPLLVGNELKSGSDNYFNAPHYQENDAFGPLPRNYGDGDLARYKRIRRVKQSHNVQELASPED